jgi:hypothetical protein
VTPACAGTGCHVGTSLTGIHLATGSTLTCNSCHKSVDPLVTAAIAANDKACTACHNGATAHGDLSVAHTATMKSTTMSILGNDYGNHACSECHSSAVVTNLHPDCTTCHPTPQDTVVPWNKRCATGGCHTSGAAAQHAQLDSAHVIGVQTCTATGCHTGAGSLAGIHAKEGCATCHAVGKTPTATCTASGCHANMNGHGDVTAIHASTMTSGPVTIFDDGAAHTSESGYAIDAQTSCALCHTSANLLTIHANDCSVCHLKASAPANSITTWSKGCSQGACHPYYHDLASSGHDGEYDGGNGNCDNCHNSVGWGGWDGKGSASWCGTCHGLGADVTPPNSTSDVKTAYIGTASIAISATDNRIVKSKYYRLDGGATQTVNGALLVEPPASGTQTHTLEYWAMDWSQNTEVRHTATFTVTPDLQPPVTSSDATSAYIGSAAIRLTATDNATSLGVRNTYYRFDSGAVTTGTVAVMPQPASGVETHTIYFWSLDFAGHVEAERSFTFTVTADHIAPTTTSDLLPIPKYYGGVTSNGIITVTMNVTDPGPSSGIAGVRVTSTSTTPMFMNGNEAEWNGSAWVIKIWCFAQGNYPITVSARDKAGNVETPKTTTIAYDYARPYTAISPASTYVGTANVVLTPSDNFSGVATTYYRDGVAGVVKEGTTVVIAPPASGSAAHTIYYWSVDKAGNVEVTKTKAITVSAP